MVPGERFMEWLRGVMEDEPDLLGVEAMMRCSKKILTTVFCSWSDAVRHRVKRLTDVVAGAVDQLMMLDNFAVADQAVQDLRTEWLRRSAVHSLLRGLVVQNERFKNHGSE